MKTKADIIKEIEELSIEHSNNTGCSVEECEDNNCADKIELRRLKARLEQQNFAEQKFDIFIKKLKGVIQVETIGTTRVRINQEINKLYEQEIKQLEEEK